MDGHEITAAITSVTPSSPTVDNEAPAILAAKARAMHFVNALHEPGFWCYYIVVYRVFYALHDSSLGYPPALCLSITPPTPQLELWYSQIQAC